MKALHSMLSVVTKCAAGHIVGMHHEKVVWSMRKCGKFGLDYFSGRPRQGVQVGSQTVAHPAAPVVHHQRPEPNSEDTRSVCVSSVAAVVLQGSVEERIIEVGRHRRAGGRLGGGASGGDQERIRGNSFWYGADEYYQAPVPENVRPCWQPLYPTLQYPALPHCMAAWLTCVSPLVPSSGVLADGSNMYNYDSTCAWSDMSDLKRLSDEGSLVKAFCQVPEQVFN